MDITMLKAAQLRTLAHDLSLLADEVEQPSRSMERSERLIADGEHIAAEIRAVFRGRG
jgi:hypothetical protein